MRKIVFVLAAMACSNAQADPLTDKLCIFSAAQKLMPIPGLTIISSQAKEANKKTVGDLIVLKAALSIPEIKVIMNRFGIYNKDYHDKIYSNYAYMDSDIVDFMKAQMNEKLAGGAEISLNIKAAGQEATFNYVCGYASDGANYVTPMGMSK